MRDVQVSEPVIGLGRGLQSRQLLDRVVAIDQLIFRTWSSPSSMPAARGPEIGLGSQPSQRAAIAMTQHECEKEGADRPPPHPFQSALQDRRPPGLDRSVRKVTVEVIRQRQRAGVPLVGLLGQALQADRLQVARNLRLEMRRRHAGLR